jgi:hypothetical protein
LQHTSRCPTAITSLRPQAGRLVIVMSEWLQLAPYRRADLFPRANLSLDCDYQIKQHHLIKYHSAFVLLKPCSAKKILRDSSLECCCCLLPRRLFSYRSFSTRSWQQWLPKNHLRFPQTLTRLMAKLTSLRAKGSLRKTSQSRTMLQRTPSPKEAPELGV